MNTNITDIKPTGIIRPIDQLGRVVIPKDLRKLHKLEPGDNVEVYTTSAGILISKHVMSCELCGKMDMDLQMFHGHKICKGCVAEIKEEL